MAWSKLELQAPEIDLSGLKALIDTIRAFVEMLVGMLEVILQIISVIADPIVAVIKKLVDVLKAAVESFLEDLGAYCLFVPIRKRLKTNFLGLGDITPAWAGELGIFGTADSPVKPRDPVMNQFISDANRYNGGNAGFFKTVVESLFDEGDLNRPIFLDEEDYVGGFVLVIGTDFDPLGFLDDLWKFSGIFSGPDLTPKVPRPKGLQARVLEGLSAQAVGSGKFSTLLLWETPEVPLWTLEDLGGIVLFPYRYAIIRGKNTADALGAGSVIDLMGTRDLKSGATNTNGDMVVIHEDEYDITKVNYLDEKIDATKDDTFYYAVAWKLKAYGASEPIKEGTGTDIDYWYISNVARVVPFPTFPDSTPPDWHRTASIASIFPQFAAILRKLVAEIEGFAAKLVGIADMFKDYIDFLRAEIYRYEYNINHLLDELEKLALKFQLPSGGIYIRPFKGKGGNDYFIADLANSLSAEKNRPPFDAGDEYVAGAVIMAGGNEVLVEALLAGLSWIFGGTPQSAALSGMLDELGEAVESVEDVVYGPDMKKLTDPDTTAFEEIYDEQLKHCGPVVVTPPVFKADMGVD
jgi:hypothetical protein